MFLFEVLLNDLLSRLKNLFLLQMDIFPYDTKDENGGERYMPFQVDYMMHIYLFLIRAHSCSNT